MEEVLRQTIVASEFRLSFSSYASFTLASLQLFDKAFSTFHGTSRLEIGGLGFWAKRAQDKCESKLGRCEE